VDWEGVDSDVKARLLDAALAWGEFAAVNTWSSTLPASTRECLSNAGFLSPDDAARSGRRRPAVLVRSVQEKGIGADWLLQGSRLLDLSSWDLRPLWGLL
jgi:hypothetical protein